MVRIQEIQIKDFKNVEHGIIKFPNKKSSGDFLNSAEVVGVYGQNGSGKTAIVEAFKIEFIYSLQYIIFVKSKVN